MKLAVDSTSAYRGFHFGLQPIQLWPTVDSTFQLMELTAKRVELTVSQSGIHCKLKWNPLQVSAKEHQ